MKRMHKNILLFCMFGMAFALFSPVIYANSDIEWISIPQSVSGEEMFYINGHYIQTNSHEIYFSDDLKRWEKVVESNSNTGKLDDGKNTPITIAYNDKIVVAVGTNGFFATSTNAKDWKTHMMSPACDISDIIWDGSKFIAVGNYTDGAAVIMKSADGINWGELEWKSWGDNITSIDYDGYTYVYTQPYSIFHTTDFKQSRDIAISEYSKFSQVNWDKYLSDVFWIKDRFFLIDESGRIASSYDGYAWGIFKDKESTQGRFFKSMAYNGKTYIAVGTKGMIYTSENGIDWVDHSNIGDSDNTYNGVVWTGKSFVVAGTKEILVWSPIDIIKIKTDEQYACMNILPVNIDDTFYISISEAKKVLGAKALYDIESQRIRIEKNNLYINMWLENKKYTANWYSSLPDEENVSDVRSTYEYEQDLYSFPQFIEGRVFIPLRFVAETLGFDVSWDEITKTVVINTCSDINHLYHI